MKTAIIKTGSPDQVRPLPEYKAFEREEAEAIWRAMGPRDETPRARLEWLLDQFVFADITRLGEEERFGLWLRLQGVVQASTAGAWSLWEPPWNESEAVALISAAAMREPGARPVVLRALRYQDRKAKMSVGIYAVSRGELIRAQGILRAVVIGLAAPQAVKVALGSVTAFVYPGATSPRGGALFFAPVASALLVAVAALLQQLAPLRLKRCAGAREDGSQCTRVFLPRKRQRWCAEHKEEARRKQLKDAQVRHRRRLRRPR